MAKRDHLTATPTVDKNGKHTTVYRKNEKDSKAGQSFPSPATPSAVHRLELNRKVSLALLDVGWHEARDRRLVVDTVKGLSVGTVLKIEQMLDSAGDDRDKLAKQITEEIKHGGEVDPDFEAKLNHSLHFYPVISDWPYSLVREIIGSLRKYEQLPPMENFTYDDDVMEKCVALLHVFDAAHLTIPDGTPWYNTLHCMFEDDRLVKLIFDNPEKSGLLAATVRDRRTIDAEILSLVVHGEASALSSGTL